MIDKAIKVQNTLNNCCGTTADDVCTTRQSMSDLTKRLKTLVEFMTATDPTFNRNNRCYDFRHTLAHIEPFANDVHDWLTTDLSEPLGMGLDGSVHVPGDVAAQLLQIMFSDDAVTREFDITVKNSTIVFKKKED